MDKNDEMEENPEVKKLKRNGVLCCSVGIIATTIMKMNDAVNIINDKYDNITRIENLYDSDSEDAKEKMKIGLMTEKEVKERIEENKRLKKKDLRNNNIETNIRAVLNVMSGVVINFFIMDISSYITSKKIDKLTSKKLEKIETKNAIDAFIGS